MSGPLEGIRVIEMGLWVAGPATGCVLADWGADVVKLEPPRQGDPARDFSKLIGGDLPFNPPFELDNRGKRSLAIDLTSDEGRAIGYQLIDGADVFITNMRMQSLTAIGFDHVTLLKRNPRLIYAAISGYGLTGPEADRPAYDIAAFWARSGLANALALPGETPPFQRGGMGDHPVAMSLAAGVSAALFARERTGKGQLVATSLLRQGLYTVSFDLNIALRFGVSVQAGNRKTMSNPAINNYRDSEDKWFWLVGLEGERHWPPLTRCAGHPEWATDPRFATPAARAENAEELIRLLDDIFSTKTREQWGKIFDSEEDMWWAPVQTFEEVLADPQVHAAGGLVEIPDGASTTTQPATPVDFGGTPGTQRGMAPELGQHSEEILAEAGVAPDRIRVLRDQGIIR